MDDVIMQIAALMASLHRRIIFVCLGCVCARHPTIACNTTAIRPVAALQVAG
jgi:hypothetical protein